jgi:hypothetical protein
MKKYSWMLAVTSVSLMSACGGGDKTPPEPALTDAVLSSSDLAINGVIATINRAGYIRVGANGTNAALTVGLGNVPLSGNAATASGNGWLPASSTFVNGSVTLSQHTGSSFYTLNVAGGNIKASSATMSAPNILVKPTLSALAGTFGDFSMTQIVVSGNSFSGTYEDNCSWTGTLTPQTNTIDVTGIVFKTRQDPLFIGVEPACPYLGKVFTGTAFLLGPSAAYAKGTLMINWDDGGANVPTQVHMMNFPRQ